METHSTSPRRQPWFSGRRWAEFPTSRPRVHDEYGFILNILDAMGSCLQGQWVWIETSLHVCCVCLCVFLFFMLQFLFFLPVFDGARQSHCPGYPYRRASTGDGA
ncbi:hypothetical protein BDQ94DRAFT_150366 [Aspergillus welwitschiae]|uniref:Uncharacterized protein n=1 Tax=Aspergillus welwitschiae TaxID=1341132 RepID=A0A3F3PRA4_9EURO|nr:hypothetical protein BDQ94DRAFT_150366 [Aspergillus welwitschiae]RDH29489.1 hypothetical protein BDQ94DRAFT_150366 [Aspergillus welwitschiae]